MASTLGRGLAAGAVGTTLINAATYADMLLTGREASAAPGRTAVAALRAAGVDPPTDGGRTEAWGALGGIAAGLGIGVAASYARRLGFRLPAPLGAVVTGAAAMAATDLPMAALGVSDPRTWTRADWVRDAVPHLVYGAGVRWMLDRSPQPPAEVRATAGQGAAGPGLLLRSLALGVAAGGRSSLGVAGALATTGHAVPARLGAVAVATEVGVDKLPSAPSRLQYASATVRMGAGGVGGYALARRASQRPLLPTVVGAAGAVVGTVAGAAWREWADGRWPRWVSAVAEDVVVGGLAVLAVRGGDRRDVARVPE